MTNIDNRRILHLWEIIRVTICIACKCQAYLIDESEDRYRLFEKRFQLFFGLANDCSVISTQRRKNMLQIRRIGKIDMRHDNYWHQLQASFEPRTHDQDHKSPLQTTGRNFRIRKWRSLKRQTENYSSLPRKNKNKRKCFIILSQWNHYHHIVRGQS